MIRAHSSAEKFLLLLEESHHPPKPYFRLTGYQKRNQQTHQAINTMTNSLITPKSHSLQNEYLLRQMSFMG